MGDNGVVLKRVGVVVRDLAAAQEAYRKYLGIRDWATADYPAEALRNVRAANGRPTTGAYRSAIGRWGAAEGVVFELVEPISGETPFNEFLLTKGPGIAWLTVTDRDPDNPNTIVSRLEGLGVPVVNSWETDQGRREFWDTRDALGGYLLEVAEPGAADPVAANAAEVSSPIPFSQVFHFGVIVDNVMESNELYHAIFGIKDFPIKAWNAEMGRLDSPQYRGKSVEHGYFTSQGMCENFGFEIIETTYGDSHYNREFSDRRGPGIHHMYAWMAKDESEWQATIDTMTELGAPVCMGSPLRAGAAEFAYFDTAELGFLIEGVIRRFPAEKRYMDPDWLVSFGA